MAKVLVTDDDPQILFLVRQALELAGHDVFSTDDPSEVLGLARATRPDAMILDVMMPSITGIELLGSLRRDPETACIPVLFLSGLGDGSDRVRGLREGADDYLVKPFEPAELVLRVERLMGRRGRAAAAPPPAEDPDHLFGRYRALDVLGEGSMGTVYRAEDPRLQRQVALKTIRLSSAGTEARRQELLGLLRQEAVTIARLSHPNVVAVYDMGETRNTAYVAMELVEGASLSELLKKRGSLAMEQVIPLGADIARGLASSHSRDVIHRDVKPGNVLLGRDGAVKVSDFGLAYVMSALSNDSADLSGTPGYVPPEVLAQSPYTKRGDVFGLGAILYESLAGQHPLAGETLRETILNTLDGKIQPLAERVPWLPEELEALVGELLCLEPEGRPEASEVVERMEAMAQQYQLRWEPGELPARKRRPLPDPRV